MHYRIVFTGDTVCGLEPGLVRARLEALMKLPPARIERLFTEAPMTIKRTGDFALSE